MSPETSRSEILIVGAGPTGLVLALGLALRGVPFRIIDRNAGPGQASRAMAVQARTLEFYRQFGFADEVVQGGIRMEILHLREAGEEVARLTLGNLGEGLSPYPFVLSFTQDDHERFLTQKLQALGVSVEWNVELKEFSDDGSTVRCLLDQSGSEEVAGFAYLCGCDGASSTVRRDLKIPFSGGTYDQRFYVADVKIAGEPSSDFFINLSGRELGIMLPVHTDSKRLIGIMPEALSNRTDVSFDDLRLDAEKLMQIQVEEVHWFSAYYVHHRVAEAFRVGRAFLLGDAGHVHSPAGGQGMNTAIGDAINLAWKLAAVMQGRAPDTILDSYEAERIDFARALVRTTDRVFRGMTDRGAGGKILRTWLMPHLLPLLSHLPRGRRTIFRTVSQTRIAYRHSPLSQGKAGLVHGGDRLPWVLANGLDNYDPLKTLDWQVHVYGELNASFISAAQTLGFAVTAFQWTVAAANAGLERNAFYLIRPDGYVALASPTQDAAILKEFASKQNLRFTPSLSA